MPEHICLSTDQLQERLSGATAVIEWFGRWPTFHDAEILEAAIVRDGVSRVRLFTWLMSNSLDKDGKYVRERPSIVEFELTDLGSVALSGGECGIQNVIGGLWFAEALEGRLRLTMSPMFGLYGFLEARHIAVKVTPSGKV
jgi:hypothetical protein